MCGASLKIKFLTLLITLLFSGVVSAQMLDDETSDGWGNLDFDVVDEQSASSQNDFVFEVPANSTVSSEIIEGQNIVTEPVAATPSNSQTVSWSNDAIPPEHIYERKDVREGSDKLLREVATGQLITGEVRDRYPTGRLLAKNRYEEGRKHGRSLMFFENGTLLSEAFYQDGKEEGDISVFYANGDEFIKVSFKDGIPVSGYCMTINGNKIDMSTAQLRDFQNEGKVPCAAKL